MTIKSINIQCPHCGTEYGADQSEIGSQVECQVCGEKFVISNPRPRVEVQKQTKTSREPVEEKTIMSVKPSIAPVVVGAIFIAGPFALLGLLFGFVGLNVVSGAGYWFIPLILVILVVSFVLGMFQLLYSGTEYTVTNKRLISKSGIISENTRQVHVHDMRDIFLFRSVFHKLTDTGSISIGSQTTGIAARIILSNIKEYQSVIATLESLRGQ